MLSTLYLLKYNNYYNRILKKLDTLTEYSEFVLGEPLANINFNPNDGVSTKQIINWNNDIPDYLLVVEGTKTIVSRWFVIESRRLLSGQFEMTLFRDCLADYLEEIKQAPMFIEKGTCSVSDNFIFNDEQVQVNQIKQSEELLIDSTGCAWVVGYVSNPEEGETNQPVSYGITSDVYDYYTPTLEDWDYYQYVSSGAAKVKFVDKLLFTYISRDDVSTDTATMYKVYENKFDKNGGVSYTDYTTGSAYQYQNATAWSQDRIYQAVTANNVSNLYSTAKTYFGLTDDVSIYNKLISIAGTGNDLKRLKVGTGNDARYYTIKVVRNNKSTESVPATNDAMYNAWVNWCKAINTESGKTLINTSGYKKDSFRTNVLAYEYHIELVESTPYSSLSFNFPAGRTSLTDAPYCMFAIPYGEIFVKKSNKAFFTVKENAISVAAGIASKFSGSGKLYDIQLLPYCPFQLLRNNSNPKRFAAEEAPFSNLQENKDYVIIDSADQVIFFCDKSTDTFTLSISQNYMSYHDALSFKAGMLTKSVRLCSPNYNGVFEFNPYKNRGFTSVNIDYTYKPFQPYIHLNPDFGGLYNKDFDDCRGLICGGDFSLPKTSDQWETYQIQNKNYQEQFNRQVENLEIQHKYQGIQDKVKAIAGTVTGTGTGAAAGAMAGGGYGAIAGAVVGGVASGVAGAYDVKINELLRNETLDYTKDLFGFQIDNIKALPEALTKVSAFNANNKIFPFIEFYSCTEEEYTAVFNKLKYNGFTINRIDNLQSALLNKSPDIGMLAYVKGQLIRLDSINDDYHIVNTIASELYKGVYV